MSTGLELIQTLNAWLKHVSHANNIACRSHNNHFSQSLPQSTDGNTLVLTSYTSMDLSTSLSLSITHDANHLQNPCITEQCCKDNIIKELFAEYGILESLCTDNGPQFVMHYLLNFDRDWQFDHSTTALRNPEEMAL